MANYLSKIELLLASKSPRRKELLESLGLKVKLVDIDVEETYPEELHPAETALFLAAKKNAAYTQVGPNQVLLSSDTIVQLHGEILGKPADKADAKRMILSLSGHYHEVITAVCLNAFGKTHRAIISKTLVKFKELKDSEINYYVDNFNPLDKAGAYGIQDWIGKVGVKEITGCYYNVMGLPVNKVIKELEKLHDSII